MSTEVRKYAGQVADYIEKHGWTQGRYKAPDGSCCLVGAMDLVLADASNSAWSGVYDAVEVKVGGPITSWNDRPERTKDEVIAVLRSIQHEQG